MRHLVCALLLNWILFARSSSTAGVQSERFRNRDAEPFVQLTKRVSSSLKTAELTRGAQSSLRNRIKLLSSMEQRLSHEEPLSLDDVPTGYTVDEALKAIAEIADAISNCKGASDAQESLSVYRQQLGQALEESAPALASHDERVEKEMQSWSLIRRELLQKLLKHVCVMKSEWSLLHTRFNVLRHRDEGNLYHNFRTWFLSRVHTENMSETGQVDQDVMERVERILNLYMITKFEFEDLCLFFDSLDEPLSADTVVAVLALVSDMEIQNRENVESTQMRMEELETQIEEASYWIKKASDCKLLNPLL